MNYEPTTALNEGIRLLQANDFAGAVTQLEQAVRQTPQEGRAHGYLGVAYARQGDLTASVQALEEAARLQPGDSAAQYNLAVALAQAQRQPEARAALEQALAIDPNNARAQSALQSLTASMPSAAPLPAVTPGGYAPAQPAPIPASLYSSASSAPDYAPSTPGYAPLAPGYAPPTVTSLTGEPIAPAMPTVNSSPVASLPADYQTPQLRQGMVPPPNAYAPMGTPAPGMGGMQYAPSAMRPMSASMPPSAGKRIGRGLGWGAAFGQWWTLLNMFWFLVYNGVPQHGGIFGVILLAVVMILFFAFVGGIVGLIIGAVDAMPDAGAMIGVVAGLLLMAGEYFLFGSASAFLNIIFWVFTGRFVGRNIAARVQQPVQA